MHRERAFEFTSKFYRDHGFPVVVSDDGRESGVFNLARARNRGVEAQAADVYVVTDADMLVDPEQIRAAATLALDEPGVVLPFDRWRTNLSEEQSALIYEGKAPWDAFPDEERPFYVKEDGTIPFDWWATPTYVFSQQTWNMIGGWDERLEGWAPDDKDFLAGSNLIRPTRVVPGHGYQLFHVQPHYDLAYREGTPEKERCDAGWSIVRSKMGRLTDIENWRRETVMSRVISELPSWFGPSNFATALSGLKERAGLRALQIGAYTGDASVWLMENVLTDKASRLVDVDTFAGSDDEAVDRWDAVRAKYDAQTWPWHERIETFVGTSDDFFAQNNEEFDIVYIDGSHHAADVARDAKNAHAVLKEGGILGFDDYWWMVGTERGDDIPRTAIDAFLAEHGAKYEVLVKHDQVWLKKTGVRPVRVAVYAPAKNEAENVLAWYESARDADEIVLVDTGSEDDTLKIATEIAAMDPKMRVRQAVVKPWRFDDGLNAALSQVSADIDIAVPLHLDERLQSGWRSELEVAWRAGARQMTFMYDWGEGLSYRHDRIHARAGYRWVGAAHEYPSGPGPRTDTNVRIVQERDAAKDRSQDDALIELAWRENPTARTTYYQGRQAYYRNRWDEARRLFLAYLAMPDSVYDQERSEACRMMAKMVYEQFQESWILKACAEAPSRREPWCDLAKFYEAHSRTREAAGAAARALSITEQTPSNSYHLESWAWDDAWLTALLTKA